MECSVCKNRSRHNYCDMCGNNTHDQVDPTSPGVEHLARAYNALMEPDNQQALTHFQRAFRYTEQLPRHLLMVAYFEYGLTVVRAAGGGPLKRLSADQLVEMSEALRQAQVMYQTLPEGIKAELRHKDYAGSISFNLDEAKRVLVSRGSPQASSTTPSPAAASGSGCSSIFCLGVVSALLLPLLLCLW